MLTGMLAVRNATLGERNDLWSVNVDQEYHEEIRQAGAPEVAVAEEAISEVFTRVDGVALGLAAGVTSGLLLLLATIALVLKGGGALNLGLLSQYFPGYSVTPGGSILGLAYGFTAGFIAGWVFAYVRNAAAFVSLIVIHRRAELQRLRRILEYL